MDERTSIDAKTLLREVKRYLEAVAVFRAEGCEPSWRPEQGVGACGTRHTVLRAAGVLRP